MDINCPVSVYDAYTACCTFYYNIYYISTKYSVKYADESHYKNYTRDFFFFKNKVHNNIMAVIIIYIRCMSPRAVFARLL